MDHCLTEFNQGITKAVCHPGRGRALTDRSGMKKRTKKMDQCVGGGISPETGLLLDCQFPSGFGVSVFNKHYYQRDVVKG